MQRCSKAEKYVVVVGSGYSDVVEMISAHGCRPSVPPSFDLWWYCESGIAARAHHHWGGEIIVDERSGVGNEMLGRE